MRFSLWALVCLLCLGCDGEATENSIIDADQDGFSSSEDCDDNSATIHPDADEICDDVDNNCDGTIDESPIDGWMVYADGDGDGFGSGEPWMACALTEGASTYGSDCDDDDSTIHPDGDEICDDVDNDCDDLIDDDDENLDAMTGGLFFLDADNDGFGDSATPLRACIAPADYVEQDGDCNDQMDMIHPDAAEVCDEMDNDCDNLIDEEACAVTSQEG